MSDVDDRMRAREERKAAVRTGLCGRCRLPRGQDGTSFHCRICADKHASTMRKRYAVQGRARQVPFVEPDWSLDPSLLPKRPPGVR